MSNQKNAVSTTDNLAGDFLKTFGKSLESYAIRKYDQSAFLKSAMIAIVNEKKLVSCLKSEAGKLSLFNAMRYAASTGLSLNPQEGKAALVAYENNKKEMIVNYQIMKNGMIDLAMDSGKLQFITSDLVRENDEFELSKTLHGDDFTFKPALVDRGPVIGYFAALKMTSPNRGGGSTLVKWMTVEECEEFRDAYSAMFKKMPDKSPWTKSFNGMAIKTVIKALLRNVAISSELDAAIGADDFYEADFHIEEPGATADEAVDKLKNKSGETTTEGNLL